MPQRREEKRVCAVQVPRDEASGSGDARRRALSVCKLCVSGVFRRVCIGL